MNDRFKFRVWNKHINEYCNIQNLFILPTGETGYFITDGSYPHQRKFMHQEDMIIEMSTGLKDKNGNLIYEGDIIHEVDKEADIDDVSQIVWCQDTCHFMQLDLPDTGLNRHCLICEADSPYIEIIGNIHKQAEQKDKR